MSLEQSDETSEQEILSKVRKKALAGGLKSISRIAIEGPVSVADKLQISLDESDNLCKIACNRLEQASVIPARYSTAQDFLARREKLLKISSGCKDLDRLLFGGIECGSLTETFGGPGVGKTQLCFTLCVNLNESAKDLKRRPKTIFIDTEKKFRPERVKQVAMARGHSPTILENIYVMSALNTSQLHGFVTLALNMIESDSSIKLLIVDSLVGLYRSEFTGRRNLLERQNRITELMKVLVNASIVYDIAVVITNQTQYSVDLDWGNKLKPVGGNAIGHMSTYRIELKKGFNHIATMVNSPYHHFSEARFMINEKGVTDC